MTALVVPAPDGCALHHTVTRPRGRGPWPVVLVRTPYDRRALAGEAAGWAAHGFACVTGDVRGRFSSEGDFRPYTTEEADGAAVVDAVRELPFCDGRVLVSGASYGAHCAVFAALARPRHVAGVLAAVPALGLGETAREPGRAARLACRVGWWSEHGGARVPRAAGPAALRRLPVGRLPVGGLPVGGLPVGGLPVRGLLDPAPPGWAALWAAPERTPALWSHVGAAATPLLAVGGTADPFAAATAELAAGWGGPARLLLGPWGHRLDADAPGAALGGARIGAVYARWARAVLAGGPAGRRSLLAAGDGWSAPGVPVPFALPGGGFVADPADPFPSRPRGTDLRGDAGRTDRLRLVTPPLPAGVLRGPVLVDLDVTAAAADADWVARLSLRGVEVALAVRRARGGPGAVRLRTAPAGVAVPAGARLVLEVAGHHFPAHARNPHTGEDPVTATALHADRRELAGVTLHLPLHPAGPAVPGTRVPEEIAR